MAGILAGAFGTGLPLALDAATFGVMTAAAAWPCRTRRGGTPDRAAPPGPERGGGWAALRRDPLLSTLIVGLAASLCCSA